MKLLTKLLHLFLFRRSTLMKVLTDFLTMFICFDYIKSSSEFLIKSIYFHHAKYQLKFLIMIRNSIRRSRIIMEEKRRSNHIPKLISEKDNEASNEAYTFISFPLFYHNESPNGLLIKRAIHIFGIAE